MFRCISLIYDFSLYYPPIRSAPLHGGVGGWGPTKMLSYMDYALAVGLCSADAMCAEAADTVDHVHEAIQVSLHVVEHAASISLKICVNLELARHLEAHLSLAVDAGTKA